MKWLDNTFGFYLTKIITVLSLCVMLIITNVCQPHLDLIKNMLIELIPKIPFQNMYTNVKRERDFDGQPCQWHELIWITVIILSKLPKPSYKQKYNAELCFTFNQSPIFAIHRSVACYEEKRPIHCSTT